MVIRILEHFEIEIRLQGGEILLSVTLSPHCEFFDRRHRFVTAGAPPPNTCINDTLVTSREARNTRRTR